MSEITLKKAGVESLWKLAEKEIKEKSLNTTRAEYLKALGELNKDYFDCIEKDGVITSVEFNKRAKSIGKNKKIQLPEFDNNKNLTVPDPKTNSFKINGCETSCPPTSNKSSDCYTDTTSDCYTIQPGDNPSKIANKLGISVGKLMVLNNLDENSAKKLKVGDTLKINVPIGAANTTGQVNNAQKANNAGGNQNSTTKLTPEELDKINNISDSADQRGLIIALADALGISLVELKSNYNLDTSATSFDSKIIVSMALELKAKDSTTLTTILSNY